jgi:hypothetical protein
VPEASSVDTKAVPHGADIVCSCVKMYCLNIGLRTNQHRLLPCENSRECKCGLC